MFAHIPNFVYFAPTTKEEYEQMFKYATSQKNHPVGIRVLPAFEKTGVKDDTDYSVLTNKVEKQGEGVAIVAFGPLLNMAKKVAEEIEKATGKSITVINPRFVSGIDDNLLTSLISNHKAVITIEDGEVMGGYGQNIASFYGNTSMKVINHGISRKFHTDYNPDQLLADHGMSVEKLVAEVKDLL